MRLRFLFSLFLQAAAIYSQPVVKIGGLPPKDVFIGIDNPVTLDSTVAGQTYTLNATGMTVTVTGLNQWIVRCTNPGAGRLLLKNASGMILQDINVKIKRTSEPRVWLRSPKGLLTAANTTRLPASLVAELQGLEMSNEIPWLPDGFQVLGFTIIFIRKNEPPIQVDVRGNRFAGDIRLRLQKVRPGDQIIIDDIKCKGVGDCSCTRALDYFKINVH